MNQFTKPFFSIVCPSYQSASFITRTLESVMAQSCLDYELIVSDDGSTDNTCEVIEQFIKKYPEKNIRLIRNSHQGPGATRNAGIRAARADWIAFLDSDDLWDSKKLETVAVLIKQYPEINTYCHNEIHRRLDGSENILDYAKSYRPDMAFKRQLYRQNLFSTSALVCQKSLVEKVGGFDPALSSAQDYELWLKMSDFMKPYFISEVLGFYIDRPENITSSNVWRRFRNNLRICMRYRHSESFGYFCYKLFYLITSLGVHLGRQILK